MTEQEITQARSDVDQLTKERDELMLQINIQAGGALRRYKMLISDSKQITKSAFDALVKHCKTGQTWQWLGRLASRPRCCFA